MMLAATVAMAGCLTLGAGSDRILASDLEPAVPPMAGLPAGTAIGLAPAPGVIRVFRIPELRVLASRLHLDFTPTHEICIQRRTSPLTPERLREAMRQTLPDARVEVFDFSSMPAPEGEIIFPISGLRESSAGEFWNGFITYAPNRRFTVWAKVRVRVKVQRVLAIGDLPAGKPIAAGQVMDVEREEFPRSVVFAGSLQEVVGKCPRFTIRAGNAIRPAQLESAKDVGRGDRVVVEVRDGAANLMLEGIAQGPGVAGEIVLIRNPDSQKCFRARVEGKGRVSVDAGPKVNP